jgi:hypothetical protein
MVCIDAYKEGLGGVLTQNGYVSSYGSRKIKENEWNYATHDLELVPVVHALNMWRHYRMGKRFKLRTYYSGLKYLFEQPTLNVRKTRWLELLSEYDFDIKNIKEKENKVVDALSRRIHLMHTTTITMHPSYLKRKFLDAIATYQHYL